MPSKIPVLSNLSVDISHELSMPTSPTFAEWCAADFFTASSGSVIHHFMEGVTTSHATKNGGELEQLSKLPYLEESRDWGDGRLTRSKRSSQTKFMRRCVVQGAGQHGVEVAVKNPLRSCKRNTVLCSRSTISANAYSFPSMYAWVWPGQVHLTACASSELFGNSMRWCALPPTVATESGVGE